MLDDWYPAYLAYDGANIDIVALVTPDINDKIVVLKHRVPYDTGLELLGLRGA